MGELKIFDNPNFGKIRAVFNNGEPMICLTDLCKVLDLSSPSKVKERLNQKGVTTIPTLTNGGTQHLVYINESNLYKVIFQSRKVEAESFSDWVASEVLPSIRKNGAYMTGETIEKALTDPDFLIRLATNLKEEKEKRIRAEKQIQEQKPKVVFADAVATSKSSILVGELAKLLRQNGFDIGQNRLFDWLRKNGFLIRRKGTDYNLPTQYSMEIGLFEIKETAITHADGHTSISKTPKVTGKGQIYFVNRFKKYGLD